MHTNKISIKRSKNSTLLTALASIILITLFSCEETAGAGNGSSAKDKDSIVPSIKFEVKRGDTLLTTATKSLESFDPSKNEDENILNIFIDEPYNEAAPLMLSIVHTPPPENKNITISPDMATEKNYSDTTAEIFEISDGEKNHKFRVNIIRKPISTATKPAANTDIYYDTSGAGAISIRKFIQTDYYYVPSMIGDEISNLPAPAFALFPAGKSPSTEAILNSPVRAIHNFNTDDGTTLFLTAVDDGIADDDWRSDDADILEGLTPNTTYTLHWAIQADNGSFRGTFDEVQTTSLPTNAPNTGNGIIKHIVKATTKNNSPSIQPFHPTTDTYLSILQFCRGNVGEIQEFSVEVSDSSGKSVITYGTTDSSAYRLKLNKHSPNYTTIILIIRGTHIGQYVLRHEATNKIVYTQLEQ